MKLITSNGKELTVYELGEPRVRFSAKAGGMVPYHGTRVVEDDEARRIVRQIIDHGSCERLS